MRRYASGHRFPVADGMFVLDKVSLAILVYMCDCKWAGSVAAFCDGRTLI